MKSFTKQLVLSVVVLLMAPAFAAADSQSDSINVDVELIAETSCNFNSVCERPLGEDEISCPEDCIEDLCSTHGDINKDGFVNLIDFSILMYYWHDEPPDNPCADINEDGIVDIKDFSIMMYWWS